MLRPGTDKVVLLEHRAERSAAQIPASTSSVSSAPVDQNGSSAVAALVVCDALAVLQDVAREDQEVPDHDTL